MTNEARREVVRALARLAASRDYQDRADAGRAMASFAELPEAREPLQKLLLDARDTFVTRATAEALLRRADAAGLAAVASALAAADSNHADWIHTAIHEVFSVYASQRDAAVLTCEAMMEGFDPPRRHGAAQLREILVEINPVLHPLGTTDSDL